MRVVLVAGTPAEHAVEVPGREGFKDFADQSYNYAIGLLKACALEKSGRSDLEILLHDIPLHRTTEELSASQVEEILGLEPDVVGFSCYAWDIHVFVKACWQIKQRQRRVKTLLGGPSASHNARRLLDAYPFLDIIVRGEGEWPFIHLCAKGFRNLSEIGGISYRALGGKVEEVGGPGLVPDLNDLPSPYLSGHFAPDSPSLLIEPSRGCRFRCAFCSWSAKGGGLRLAGWRRLFGEVRWALDHGYRFLNFCDTAINHDTQVLREFCQTLREADPEHKLALSVFLRQESLDEEQFAILDTMRFDEIIFGLESIHPEPLNACGKHALDIELFERRLARLERAGQKVTLSFISGLPGDSVEGFRQTLEYLEALQHRMPNLVNIMCCFWLSVLPGTRFDAKKDEFGFKTVPRGTPYITSSRDHTPEDLKAMARLLVDCCARNEHFRCEEIHRDAAEGRFLARQRPLIPLRLGDVVAGWTLVMADSRASAERQGTYRFQRGSSVLEVMVERRNDEKPSFLRTSRFNLYYHAQTAPGPEPSEVEELLRAFAQAAEPGEG